MGDLSKSGGYGGVFFSPFVHSSKDINAIQCGKNFAVVS